MVEKVFRLSSIRRVHPDEKKRLICIGVDSEKHQFLFGEHGIPTHNTDEAKAEMQLKGEAQSIIGQIARLGRAAGVHLMIATQRPDARMLPGELKENLMFRAGCGHITSTASSMLFDDDTGTRTPGEPKGRAATMSVGQKPKQVQVYFTEDFKWMVKWLAEQRHQNPDLTPLETGPSVATSSGIDKIKGATAEEALGIDNSADIEAIEEERRKAAQAHEDAVRNMSNKSSDEDGNAVSGRDGSPQGADFEGVKVPTMKGTQSEQKHDPREDWDDLMDEIVDDE